ncbi:DEAD/DEAH box helicase [Fredinandcohnia quinoae]|uniref:DEAD/DEAH box helicase n=1 Tax=Fredinandcohnia quinoae TaxID=2918902 RepID=A0AAW5DWQ8_9BACI|nr:DEAD/DEAH box helicase [Fredinandcohnia sp. SECRCQ15]MCH1625080.1 DEAD/DEAH box helicase [Fredinandcohnia sp. SECRCQ15]
MRFFQNNEQLLIPEPLTDKQDHPQLKPISHFEQLPSVFPNTTYTFSTELEQILYGKQLFLENLPLPIEQLHQHYVNGYLSYRKGIENQMCIRCGNENPSLFAKFSCSRCKHECTYCRKCISMGRVSECTPLISWTGPKPQDSIPLKPLVWNGTLSVGQQKASEALVDTVKHNDQILIWAVCGAGKTEILFEGIEAALLENKRVCIATPRTDVVIELAPRIKSAFPQIEVIALYGGSEDHGSTAPLTIATTHQLLRFYRAFDMIIIDEVDAFPYSAEPMLQYAVDQAKKDTSSTIYLTATPNNKWKQEIAAGKRKAVTIPARYHRHPLPVPTFAWCGNWEKKVKKQKLPQNVLQWIKDHLKSHKQAFLFVPRIDYIKIVVSILQKLDHRIEGVYSEDPRRKDKVSAFRRGEIPILVTTTILERGVTVPKIDVAVLGAEDTIFTESALVQISGRVGRSSDYPTGSIIFFHYGKTKEMIQAKKHIEGMNKEASEKGLLEV